MCRYVGARKRMKVKVVKKAKAYNLVVNLQPGDVEVRVGERAGVVVHVRCKGEGNISLQSSGGKKRRYAPTQLPGQPSWL